MSKTIEGLLEKANTSSDSSVNSAKRTFRTESAAAAFFNEVAEKMFDIREWKKNSTPSSYEHFSADGKKVRGRAFEKGDFIRISIAGSGKYDWVELHKITRRPDEIILTVRPSYDPTGKVIETERISHFFHAKARNNFCLQLDGRSVSFYVIGLSERQNITRTSGVIEAVRNAAAANLGYYLGLQKGVWKEFSRNFLRTEKEKAA